MRPTLYADDLADLRDKYGGPLAKAVEPFERILPRPCPVRCSAIDTDGTVGPDTGCAHDRCHERAGEQNCRGRGFVPQPVPDTWMSTWTTPADDPDPSWQAARRSAWGRACADAWEALGILEED